MNLGENIIKLRKACKMSAVELSKRVGISPAYLSEIENGKKTPALDVLQKIAQELNTIVSELIGDIPPELERLFSAVKPLALEEISHLNDFLLSDTKTLMKLKTPRGPKILNANIENTQEHFIKIITLGLIESEVLNLFFKLANLSKEERISLIVILEGLLARRKLNEEKNQDDV
jgi:transcriptional regulator with XRE-family HTH domain